MELPAPAVDGVDAMHGVEHQPVLIDDAWVRRNHDREDNIESALHLQLILHQPVLLIHL